MLLVQRHRPLPAMQPLRRANSSVDRPNPFEKAFERDRRLPRKIKTVPFRTALFTLRFQKAAQLSRLDAPPIVVEFTAA